MIDFIHVFCQKNRVTSTAHSVVRTNREVIPFPWPWVIARHLFKHGPLILQFVKRDVLSRYRGSYLGMFWSLLRPLSTLAVYTIVFGYIFESKLGNGPTESKLDFTITLFCGLILFEFIAECLSRAPTLILANSNYVTKVVFPLEILPVSVTGAALVQMFFSFMPLFVIMFLFGGGIPLTALWLPVVLVPLLLLTLGICWFLASFGVFIRDINSTMPVVLQILMFASAIFYSINRVPPHVRRYLLLNPIAGIINQVRGVVLWGVLPDWSHYLALLAFGLVMLVSGYAFFMRTKGAFADVM